MSKFLDETGFSYAWERTKQYIDNQKGTYLVSVPVGTIVLWSGSIEEIPDGWRLCDGTGGTPDLRDKFVVGAGNEYRPKDIGGEKEVTLTVDQMPAHNHAANYVTSDKSNTTKNPPYAIGPENAGESLNTWYWNNAHYNTYSEHIQKAGASKPHNNLPPFYALCYIMKIAADETDSAEIYSEKETVIGTWFGKPLYAKALQFNTGSTFGTWVNIADPLKDLDILVHLNCLIRTDSGACPLPMFQTPSGTLYAIAVYFQNNDPGLHIFMTNTANPTFANKSAIATFKYTKTTD